MKLMKKARSVFALSAVVGIALASAGCGGGGNDSPTYMGPAWYNVYGNVCGYGAPSPGCNFYYNGVKITDINDPYYATSYMLSYGTYYYYDSYGVYSVYTGWAWQSPNGIIYDSYGYALNKTQQKAGKDVVAHAADQEQAVVTQAGTDFADRYGLTEDVGIRVATTLNDWATLGKYRARTEDDLKDFTKRLYGVDMTDAAKALTAAKQGDKSALEEANKKMAATWKTDPEVTSRVLKDWYQDKLSEFNVQ